MILTWCIVSVVASYLLGSIPFGLLIPKWVAGVDVRTIGSGNIGATNVRRALGWKFFFLVLFLDALKGWLPTWGLAQLAVPLFGKSAPTYLPILCALASILGHNFSIYLKFQGGKGVATSLGAVLALDPFTTALAAVGVAVVLLLTGYMSLACIIGAIIFCGARLTLVPNSFDDKEMPMTVLMFALTLMMIVKHRKNLVRLANGNEPKIWDKSKSKKAEPTLEPENRPAGRMLTVMVAIIALIAVSAVGLGAWLSQPSKLALPEFTLDVVHRIEPRFQRAERVAFGDQGRILAATYPRYGRLCLFKIDAQASQVATLTREIDLTARAVALRTSSKAIWILCSPMGDQRHLQKSWLEPIGFDGQGGSESQRAEVGFHATDFVLSQDEQRAYVLTSEGNEGEGDSTKGKPALVVMNLESNPPVEIHRHLFIEPKDRPEKIAISPQSQMAAVALAGSDRIVRFDLTNRDRPQLIASTPFAKVGEIAFGSDQSLLITHFDRGIWQWSLNQTTPQAWNEQEFATGLLELESGKTWIAGLQRPSGLGVYNQNGKQLGVLPLRGAGQLTGIRPLGLAYDPVSGWIAIANQSGGSIHLARKLPH